MPATLPLETTDDVIDYLHDDKSALLACSLTSLAWRTRSQLHLFRSVDLSDRRVATRLVRALTSAPHLAAHIREVKLRMPLSKGCSDFIAWGPLHRVTSLVLMGSNGDGNLTDNNVPKARLQEAYPGIHTLTIHTVCFSTLPALMNLLHVFTHLSSLRLRRVSVRTPTASTTHSQLSLHSLILEDCHVTNPVSSGFFMHVYQLRYLQAHGRHYIYHGAGALAARTSATLEELDIQACSMQTIEDFVNECKHERPPRLGALRSLRFCVLGSNDVQRDFVCFIQFVRDLAPDDQAVVTLASAEPRRNSTYKTQWAVVLDELTRAPFPWKCTMLVEDLPGLTNTRIAHTALEEMGVILTGVPTVIHARR